MNVSKSVNKQNYAENKGLKWIGTVCNGSRKTWESRGHQIPPINYTMNHRETVKCGK